jgi:hypothetical protein
MRSRDSGTNERVTRRASTPRPRTGAALALAAALVGVVGTASAEEADTDQPVDLSEPAPATPEPQPEESSPLDTHDRRCGFTFGLVGGGMLGSVEGFPNDSVKINRFEYFTDIGFAGGGQGAGFVGIALVDWLVFGVEGHGGRVFSSDHRTTFFGGGFHIDAFPLFPLGGELEELGVTLSAGVGISNTVRADDPEQADIQSGGASRINLGLFYEGFRLWKLSMGPFISYDQIWSQSAWRPSAWIGWRTALYAGPS